MQKIVDSCCFGTLCPKCSERVMKAESSIFPNFARQLERELSEAKEQLAEKDKQIEEMIHRTLEWVDCNTCPFGNNNDSKCAVNCREKLIHYFKTGKKEEEEENENS